MRPLRTSLCPYCPLTAQALYKRRRETCRPHKRLEYAPPHSYIQICILEYHWSLEEIVGRIQLEHGCRLVSVPTIYRAIHADLLTPPGASVKFVLEATASRETASQEKQGRASWQIRHIAPHRRSSCQRGEPFHPRPLGSGYRSGQAGKGMPRHVGGLEEPVLAWRESHEQDCCSQQGDV